MKKTTFHANLLNLSKHSSIEMVSTKPALGVCRGNDSWMDFLGTLRLKNSCHESFLFISVECFGKASQICKCPEIGKAFQKVYRPPLHSQEVYSESCALWPKQVQILAYSYWLEYLNASRRRNLQYLMFSKTVPCWYLKVKMQVRLKTHV